MTKRIDKETIVTLKSVYNQLTKKAIQGQGEGWVSLAEFGLQLRKIGFDFSEYGYQQLFYFLTGTNAFSFYSDTSKNPPIKYARDKDYNGEEAKSVRIISPKHDSGSISPLDNPNIPPLLKSYYDILINDGEISYPEVVGLYEIDEKGQYQFSDIRDTLFQEHKYPAIDQNDEDREILIPLDGPLYTLKPNTYYKFNWVVRPENNRRGYALDYDRTKPAKRINPQELTKSLHDLWDDRKHGPAMNDAMQTISSELMASSDGTFIYELLQNANDYPQTNKSGKALPVDVEFHMTDKFLICRHTGAPFSPKDVASISRIGSGSKTKNKNAIGYKGIGFKTVFHAHDWVYVKTGLYSFRFDKDHEKEGRPFQIMPVWTSQSELTSLDASLSELITSGAHTFFVQTVMKPRKPEYLYGMDSDAESEKSHEYVLRNMFKDIRDIIFIPNIKTVKVFFPGEEPIICSKGDSHDWVVSSPYVHTLDPLTEKKLILDECNQHPERRIPPKYKSYDDTYVSFAAMTDGNVILPVKDATVNCYLPTKAEFGFPFLMNTDMVPSGDRSQLKVDVRFNQLFARIAGRKFVLWLSQLLSDGYEPCSVFNLIPDFKTIKDGVGKQYKLFIDCFEEGFKETINAIPIIPVEGSKDLKLPCNVLRDVTGFSAKNIIRYDNFLEYTNHKALFLPLSSICDNKRLVSLLNDCDDCIKFHDADLIDLFDHEHFRKDLLDVTTNAKVIEFLLDYKYIDKYKNISLFIDNEKGKLSCSSALYYDIDEDRKLLSAFENQLSFLSIKTREALKNDSLDVNDYNERLKMSFSWAEFKAYPSVIKQLFEINENKAENMSLLKIGQNNLDMFEFVAKHHIKAEVVKSFPILLSEGLWGTLSDICFFHSKDAIDSKSAKWLDGKWYSILSSKYFKSEPAIDEAAIATFTHFGVKKYSKRAFYDIVIKNHIEDINLKCNSDFEAFSELVSFLYQIKDEKEIGSFNLFTIPVICKDGGISHKSGKSATIFLYEPENENNKIIFDLINKKWIADGWAYLIDNSCFTILASNDKKEVIKFFKEKFSVKEPSINGFCKDVVIKHVDEIVKTITPVFKTKDESLEIIKKRNSVREDNLDFFRFVCDNNPYMFADGVNPFFSSGFPFCLCHSESIEANPKKYYKYSTSALQAASQNWLPEGLIGVIDEGYQTISTSLYKEKEFYSLLGVHEFSYSTFLNEDVCGNKDRVVGAMNSMEKNVSFHKFFKNNRISFTKEDLELLKGFPVFVLADETPTVSLSSTGHHIINPDADKLIEAGYGTASSMDIIPWDYLDSDESSDTEYWIDTLGNTKFSFKEISEWMVLEAKDTITQKITSLQDNLLFWRIVKEIPSSSNKENQKNLRALRVFPIYNRRINSTIKECSVLDSSSQCYLSDSYFFGDNGLEYVLKEYAPASIIVLGDYLQNSCEESILSWKKFWEAAGFLSSNEELIIETIIPNLDKQENQNPRVPLLLYQNKDIINKHLNDTSNPEKQQRIKDGLNNLYIETKGGLLPISSAFFIIRNEYAPFEEPMAFMPLLNQVKDYPEEQYSFFLSIGERAGSGKITTQDSWRLEKMKQFASMQSTSIESSTSFVGTLDIASIHDQFIEALAAWWTQSNSYEYSTYFRSIRLYDENNSLCFVNEMTEGTAYSPYCDFQSCGITTPLKYISDRYATIKGIRNLLASMGIHYFFVKEDIPLLKHKDFASYFWNIYLADSGARERVSQYISDGLFKDVQCVPTVNGVKKAEEIYNTFSGNKKENLAPFVNVLKNGDDYRAEKIIEVFKDKDDETKLYPNPICGLNFVEKLSKNHCFEYLLNSKVENTSKRKSVLSVLKDYLDSGDISKEDIDLYRSSTSANWLNGKKESSHINSLYAIGRQPEDRVYLRHFGNDPLIINNDTISDKDDDFEKICHDILKIKVLHGGINSDFITKPSIDCIDESDQIRSILIQKSLLLATIINAPEGEEWKTAYETYCTKIKPLRFVKCSSMTIEYSQDCNLCRKDVDAFHFDNANQTFYYLKDWQHKFVFDSMWKQLIEVLSIPGKNDEMTIKRILDKDLDDSDVYGLISVYCSDYYYDDLFIQLLGTHYPAILKRLSIIPHVTVEEEEPQVLVGFSLDRVNHDSVGEVDKDIVHDNDDTKVSKLSLSSHETEPSNLTTADSDKDNPSSSDSDSDIKALPKSTFTTKEAVVERESPSLVNSNTASGHGGFSTDDAGLENETFIDQEEVLEDFGGRLDFPRKQGKPWISPKEGLEKLRYKGAPIQLRSLEPTAEEISMLEECGISAEQIGDANYLAQLRLYKTITEIRGEEPEESFSDFVHNANNKAVHALKDGRYIHACSAARGVMYVGKTVWRKMMDDKWSICVYKDGKGLDFLFIDSKEQFLDIVSKDDLILKITGPEKVEVVDTLYSTLLNEAVGTAYTLVRVVDRTSIDSLFANYVGEMADSENEETSEY